MSRNGLALRSLFRRHRRHQQQSRIICVTGMHSGGTSAVARVVNLLGVYLGPIEEVSAPAPGYNLRGLWEYLEMTRVSDGILRTLGGSWDVLPALERGWHRSSALEPQRERVAELVAATFAGEPVWGWKDPRSCLLLPFWEDVRGPVEVVAVVRNPNDVVASLGSRNGFDREHALALWERYAAGMLAALKTHRSTALVYEDLWDGPEAFASLAEFLGRTGAERTAEFAAAIAAWIDESMWHHRSGRDEKSAIAGLSTEQRDLYEALVSHAA